MWLGMLLCIIMVTVGKSAFNYSHHEGGGLLRVFMMRRANLLYTMRIMKVLSSLLSYFMIPKAQFRMCLALYYPNS